MNYEYEINVIELFKYIKKKWKHLLISGILLCLIGAGYSLLNTKYLDRAQSTLYVIKEVEKTPVEKTNILTRKDIIEDALEESGSSLSADSALKLIDITRQPYSMEIQITYSTNENNAADVLACLMVKFAAAINSVPNYHVSVYQSPTKLSPIKSGPSLKRYSVLGFVGGVFACAFVLAFSYIKEDKIRDKEYVESQLRLNIISDDDDIKKEYYDLRNCLKYKYSKMSVIYIHYFDSENSKVAEEIAGAFGKSERVLMIENKSDSYVIDDISNISNLIKNREESDCSYDFVSLDCEGPNGKNGLSWRDIFEWAKANYDHTFINSDLSQSELNELVIEAESDGTLIVVSKDVTSNKTVMEYLKKSKLVDSLILGTIFKNSI